VLPLAGLAVTVFVVMSASEPEPGDPVNPGELVQISVLGAYGREYDVVLDGQKGRTGADDPVKFLVPLKKRVEIVCKPVGSGSLQTIPFTALKDDTFSCGR
jgi:hypothetical protein